MKILIKNIKELVQVREEGITPIAGVEMKILPTIKNAYLAIEDGIIVDYGTMEEWPGITDWSNLEVIDAEGRMVFPSWVDSHTHIVYAGNRESEFVDRINGLSYQEIAQRGGGILNSADKLANASEEELFDAAIQRIDEVILQGTGAIEIKSGYGLTLESELKMLRVIKRLKENTLLPIKSTFLGAHAVPCGMNKEEYVNTLINNWIPKVAAEGLADYCDVFCESGYFSYEDTVAILEAGTKHGLKPKVHANQMSYSGGVQAGVKCNAISVDHLEYVGDAEIETLTGSTTMPTVLPGAAYFLSLPEPPARLMIDNGLPLALASDFNPGSSPSGNMNFAVSFACIRLKMTPEEAINAATLNSAYAMDVINDCGSITRGKLANIFITKPITSIAFLPYSFGSNLIEGIILKGKILKAMN